MKHFPLREIGCAVGFILLLGIFYVGGYYALVITHPELLDPGLLRLKRGTFGPSTYRIAPEYRFGSDNSVRFFAPMHDLDKWLRPSLWELTVP